MAPPRTRSMELRAIRNAAKASLPPPPVGAGVREWFAGLALSNSELMRGLSPSERATEAVRLADELVKALQAPRTPSQESLKVPEGEQELVESWNGMARAMGSAEKKEKRERATNPGIPALMRSERTITIHPPPVEETPGACFKRASDMLSTLIPQKSRLPFPTVHSSHQLNSEEE